MLCCSWAICFSAAPSSVNDHGSMNFASKTAPVASTMPSRVAAHPADYGMPHAALDLREHLPGIAFVPKAIEGLGGEAELDDKVAREILRLDFAALFAPQADEGHLIIAHD